VGNFINSTTLIPFIPLVTSLFIFILLVSFNRTLNRLTKPVTALVALSLLSSALISSFDYFKKIEEELALIYPDIVKCDRMCLEKEDTLIEEKNLPFKKIRDLID